MRGYFGHASEAAPARARTGSSSQPPSSKCNSSFENCQDESKIQNFHEEHVKSEDMQLWTMLSYLVPETHLKKVNGTSKYFNLIWVWDLKCTPVSVERFSIGLRLFLIIDFHNRSGLVTKTPFKVYGQKLHVQRRWPCYWCVRIDIHLTSGKVVMKWWCEPGQPQTYS